MSTQLGMWLVMAEMEPERVFVQVIDVDVATDREITFGRNLAEGLGDRVALRPRPPARSP